jgi:archaeosine-15-forming tRNA-guanine transglycosylase
MKNETGGFKKRSELSRAEKIELLKLIASGDIDKDEIDSETLFTSSDGAFPLMVHGAQCLREGKEMPNVVVLAKKGIDNFAKMLEEVEKYDREKRAERENLT